MKRLLPQPMFSLFLWLIWLLLVNTVAPGQMVLGALLAMAIPLFTIRFWPDQPCMRSPLTLVAYLAVFFFDIVIANLTVARLILGPVRRLRPAFITLPLGSEERFRHHPLGPHHLPHSRDSVVAGGGRSTQPAHSRPGPG